MQIEIPEPLLKRLQIHATPFVDTPISVIERLADYYEEHQRQPTTPETNSPRAETTVRKLDPDQPPSLMHTRVHGEFDGIPFTKWNDLLRIAHIQAVKRDVAVEDLHRISRAQIKKGSHTTEGFKPVSEIGMSLQGVDANHAWEYSLRLAKHLQIRIRAKIEWRFNGKAAFPGEQALVEWQPK